MAKIDLKKELRSLYNPSASDVSLVDVPTMNFLMIDGEGNPNTSQQYADAVEALYALSYALKFKVRQSASGVDYGVMPLEGLWWVDDMATFSVEHKDAWQWTMMIMQPEYVTAELVAVVLREVERKKALPALHGVRFEPYHEGRAAQIMHIGPYSAEGPTVARLHEFIEQRGYRRRGKHHEIYLGDPRRSAPEKLHTVLRQPIE
ncbi:MAG TPA: GyrI-like domain-containing protein [Herpetosiphonaceae bacterium]